MWDSKIYLVRPFFQEIINRPVPIDMNTLTALKRLKLGLDLYLWLTYRTFTLRARYASPGVRYTAKFGVDPGPQQRQSYVRNFQRKVLRELKKIKLAWPELNYTTAPGVLVLHPRHRLSLRHPNRYASRDSSEASPTGRAR